MDEDVLGPVRGRHGLGAGLNRCGPGGSLAFIATDAWSANIHLMGFSTVGNITFKMVFIWISIGVAIASLRRGKWIPNVGAIVRVGVRGSSRSRYRSMRSSTASTASAPRFRAEHDMLDLPLGLVPLLLFNYVGFELQNSAAEEMQDPSTTSR